MFIFEASQSLESNSCEFLVLPPRIHESFEAIATALAGFEFRAVKAEQWAALIHRSKLPPPVNF